MEGELRKASDNLRLTLFHETQLASAFQVRTKYMPARKNSRPTCTYVGAAIP